MATTELPGDELRNLVTELADAVRKRRAGRFYPFNANGQGFGKPWEVRPLESGDVEVWRATGGNLKSEDPQSNHRLERVLTLRPNKREIVTHLPEILRTAYWDIQVMWGEINVEEDRLGYSTDPDELFDVKLLKFSMDLELLPALVMESEPVSITLGQTNPKLRGLDRRADLQRILRIITDNLWRERIHAKVVSTSYVLTRALPVMEIPGVDVRIHLTPRTSAFKKFPWKTPQGQTATLEQLQSTELTVAPPMRSINDYLFTCRWMLNGSRTTGLYHVEKNMRGLRWMVWQNALLLETDFQHDQNVLHPLLYALYGATVPQLQWVRAGADTRRRRENVLPTADVVRLSGTKEILLSQQDREPNFSITMTEVPEMTKAPPPPRGRFEPPSPVTPIRCAACHEPATLKCQGCTQQHYCSVRCQVAHWRWGEHSEECE